MAAPQPNRYLQYLPAIFQRKPADEQEPVLGQFLAPFENQFAAFEQILADVDRNFSASLAPAGDFLPWLAGWVAHLFDEEWDEDRRRRFLAAAIELYRWRGTVGGLKRYLDLCLDLDADKVDIREGRWPGGMQIGVASRIGYVINGGPDKPGRTVAQYPAVDLVSHDWYVVDTVTPTDLPSGLAGESFPDGERIQLYYDANFIHRIVLQPDGVRLGYFERFLFSVGLEFIGELDAKHVSAALRDQFGAYGHILAQDARVAVEKVGSRWTLVDVDKKYDIHRENDTLKVYSDRNATGEGRILRQFFHRCPPEDPQDPGKPNIQRRNGLVDYRSVPLDKASPVLAGGTLLVGELERPYRFIVDIRRAFSQESEAEQFWRKVRDILNAEKPAHTEYYVRFTPVAGRPGLRFMQIGERSSIGLDTTVA